MKTKRHGILFLLLAGVAFIGTGCSDFQPTVSFSTNEKYGGTGASLSGARIVTADSGDVITLPYPTVDADGRIMLGFSEDATAEGAEYEPGASYTVTDDAVLYAIWAEDTLPAVKYADADDGTIEIIASTETVSGAIVIPAYKDGKKISAVGLNAFSNCTGLTSVVIPSTVKSIGEGAFQGCMSLTSVSIPSGVTSIGYSAFSNCKDLKSVTISSSVTSIGGMAFSYCKNLAAVTLPYGVETVGRSAFYGCSALTNVEIPASMETIKDYAFAYCAVNKNLAVNYNGTEEGWNAIGVSTNAFTDTTGSVFCTADKTTIQISSS